VGACRLAAMASVAMTSCDRTANDFVECCVAAERAADQHGKTRKHFTDAVRFYQKTWEEVGVITNSMDVPYGYSLTFQKSNHFARPWNEPPNDYGSLGDMWSDIELIHEDLVRMDKQCDEVHEAFQRKLVAFALSRRP
jgi:hypothetical protein